MKLGELIPRVRTAYDEFEFHTIFHALNNFCSVDMSAVYLDILKDRLYTFDKDSPLRRGSQTVLFDILTALTKLMAPILSFTAEEIWRLLPEAAKAEASSSVHLAMFPEADPKWADPELSTRWERLQTVRLDVQSALEIERRKKTIGASLEAKVIIGALPGIFDLLYGLDLTAFFIVSEVEVKQVESIPAEGHTLCDPSIELYVDVEKATGQKCERCWNYRAAVGTYPDHPTLCDRCIEPVRKYFGEAAR
jgi:isoleucyl-tRNA synthetase